MNVFTRQLDFFKSEFELDRDEEIKLLKHLVESSNNLTIEESVEALLGSHDLEELLIKYISNEQILDLVQMNSLTEDVINSSEVPVRTLLKELNPQQASYHLAFDDPELGTKLLDELLYYRKLGRI